MSSIVALPPPVHLTYGERLLGWAALAAARLILAATRAKPSPLTSELRRYSSGARPATFAETERAWKVIITLSPRCGSDTHCLLRSIAIALFCRTSGSWPTWRTGVRFPPLHSHAWVEADGRPVGDDQHAIATYTPTLSVTTTMETATPTTRPPTRPPVQPANRQHEQGPPMTVTSQIADRLTAYAADLTRKGAIRTEHVASAFAAVPRHLFVNTIYQGGDRLVLGAHPDERVLEQIYSDRSLMTHIPDDEAGGYSSASQPSLVAKMLEALRLEPGMRVLEIGAGTGYNAALIATITDVPVITLDVSQAVAAEAAAALDRAGIDSVTALHGDGYLGHPTGGPYDRIIVTCGVTGASPHWLDQLAPGGLALAPTAHGGQHPLLAITQQGRVPTARAVSHADFMTAAGPLYRWPAHRIRTPTSAVPADALTITGSIGPELNDTDYQALWFHLAAHDPRTTRAWTDGIDPNQGLCALHDPQTGTAWLHRDGTAHHTGDLALLDQLAELVTAWTDTRRPSISDWTATLEPIGPPAQLVHTPASWHTTR